MKKNRLRGIFLCDLPDILAQVWPEDQRARLEQAFNFGLGEPKKEGGYPTIFVAGIDEGKTGVYRSTDAGVTWEKIASRPLGIFDWIDAMGAIRRFSAKWIWHSPAPDLLTVRKSPHPDREAKVFLPESRGTE